MPVPGVKALPLTDGVGGHLTCGSAPSQGRRVSGSFDGMAPRRPGPGSTTVAAGPDRAKLRLLGEEILRTETGATRIVRVCPRCGSDGHGLPTAIGSTATVSIAY